MDQVLVTESSLEEIADAIREKNGLETTYKPAQMAPAIRSLHVGGSAEEITYNNTSSGLDAENVQSAIDELESEISNRVLWWQSKSISSTGRSSGTLLTITDPAITADHVLDKFVAANPSVITSAITCTTSAGQAVFTGVSTAATNAEIKLVKKDN